MRRIGNGAVLPSNEIVGELGPTVSTEVVNYLLSGAAESGNSEALHELHKLAVSTGIKTPEGKIIDELEAKRTAIGVELLSNAYLAGREMIVWALLNRGFALQPSDVPYTVLLTSVCQVQNYPACLLESLLEQEDSIVQPFQDSTKEEVWDRCLAYCCSNDRRDLVELLIRKISFDGERYSSCIGRALSRIGSRYYAAQGRRESTGYCVDICWDNLGLFFLCDEWLTKTNLGAFITKLNVSDNQLSSIPYSLLDGTLQLLEEVDCSKNKLKSLWSDDVPCPSTYKYR